jgi:hypothetical protein
MNGPLISQYVSFYTLSNDLPVTNIAWSPENTLLSISAISQMINTAPHSCVGMNVAVSEVVEMWLCL